MSRRIDRTGWWVWGLATLGAVFGAWRLGFDGATLRSLGETTGPHLAPYFQPSWNDLPRIGWLLGETVAMGLFGTLVTMALALPATLFAARTVSPHPVAFHVSRQILNFLRAMPDALIAMVLVQGFGLGPLPGALALGLHSGGFIGKTLSERCERLDPKILEGLRSCGANWIQVMRFGVWPSVEREIVGECLYILDRNIRVATTLGLVGAGGIGMKLMTDLRTFHAADAATVIVCVMALVLAVDTASTFIRRRLA